MGIKLYIYHPINLHGGEIRLVNIFNTRKGKLWQRQVFVEEYVRSGDHLEAAKKAGYKDTHTLRNQACKLRRECADEITDELHRNFAEIAPRALNILSDLAENAESESVRLGATRDLLDRAGFRPVDRHEIVKEKSVEELNAQLVSLVGEDGAEMLISAFRSRKSISGPELAALHSP